MPYGYVHVHVSQANVPVRRVVASVLTENQNSMRHDYYCTIKNHEMPFHDVEEYPHMSFQDKYFFQNVEF